MTLDYAHLCATWNPWSVIPDEYNLGVALTHGQVVAGKGDKPALLWENAAGGSGCLTYRQLDVLTNRLRPQPATLWSSFRCDRPGAIGGAQYSRVFVTPGLGTGYLPSLSGCRGAGDSAVSLSRRVRAS